MAPQSEMLSRFPNNPTSFGDLSIILVSSRVHVSERFKPSEPFADLVPTGERLAHEPCYQPSLAGHIKAARPSLVTERQFTRVEGGPAILRCRPYSTRARPCTGHPESKSFS
jgi:hypothetical protein